MSAYTPSRNIVLSVLLYVILDSTTELQIFGTDNSVNYCPPKCSCPSTEKVSCDGALFATIPGNLSASLRHLTIRNSRLQTVTTDAFRRLAHLHTVILEHNADLRRVQRHAFRGLRRLKVLRVRHNRNLKTLEAHSFADIGSRKHLKLVVRDNGVETVERFAFAGNRGVRTLDLRSNPTKTLRRFAFSGLRQVDFLYLPDRLVTIERQAFANLSGVHHMQISGWQAAAAGGVQRGTFDLGRVRLLSVSDSDLGTVHPLAFDGLHTVKRVEIVDSRIGRLRRRAFVGLRNVGAVRLANNSIGRVDRYFFNHTMDVPVRFEMNRLDCACRTMWLLEADAFLAETGGASLLRNNFCATPKRVERLALADIPDSYLEHCRRIAARPQAYVNADVKQASMTSRFLVPFCVLMVNMRL